VTDPAYYVQKAVHGRLIANAALTTMVPAANMVDDYGGVPTRFPCILVGEAQVVDEGHDIARTVNRVYLTLHLWTAEPRLTMVKKIAGALRAALGGPRLTLEGGYHLADLYIVDTRYIRDPSGANGHGVVTINALVGRS